MVHQQQAMNFFHFENNQRGMYFDDKYKKLEEAERSEWRRRLVWNLVKVLVVLLILAGIAYFLNQQYEQLKLKMLENPVVSLYLNNGCKGEKIDLSLVSGKEFSRKGVSIREISFCDLHFADNLPANDQIRSVLIRPNTHVVLYEHCFGPEKQVEKIGNGQTRTHGPYKALGPALSGGWMKFFSKCHDLKGKETQASFLDIYTEIPPSDL